MEYYNSQLNVYWRVLNICDTFLFVYFYLCRLKPERNAYYLIESRSEEPNEEESDNNMVSLNFLTLLGDCGRLFRSYVLLERLSPNDIQHLS